MLLLVVVVVLGHLLVPMVAINVFVVALAVMSFPIANDDL